MNSLLRQVATIELPAVARFIVAEHFKEDLTAAVRISILSDDFGEFFLGLTEQNVPADKLTGWDLEGVPLPSCIWDSRIRAELGDREPTFLAQLWELLSRQGNGQPGPLYAHAGHSNVFYIVDVAGNTRAVDAIWRDECCWMVSAHSIEDPNAFCATDMHGWLAGDRIFSR